MSSLSTYPLTHAQKRVWYTETFYPGTSLYNIGGKVVLRAAVDIDLMNEALNEFVLTNETIRLRLTAPEGGEARQYVSDYVPFTTAFTDFCGSEDLSALEAWMVQRMQTPIVLYDASLFDFALFRVNKEEYWFFIKLHHIISDGISIVLAVNEIIDIYLRLSGGEREPVGPKASYLDYLDSERDYEASERVKKDRAFWHEEFAKLPEFTELTEYDLYGTPTEAVRETLVIPTGLQEDIQRFCKEHQISVFTLFMTLMFVYLHRVTGHEDLVVGTNFANRSSAKEKSMLGMFVSTTPFRMQVQPDTDLISFIRAVGKKQMNIFRYQKFPYNLLVGELREKHNHINRLFGIFVEYQVMEWQKKEQMEYMAEGIFSGHEANDLIVHIKDRLDTGELQLDVDYRTGLFSKEEIRCMLNRLVVMLQDAIRHPDMPLFELELYAEEEKRQLLGGLAGPAADYPRDLTIHGRFEEQARLWPERTAVVFEEKRITYRELNEQSNRLARVLRERGVHPDRPCAILLDRSIDMITAILAVLKAGGAYVPVDIDYPDERIAFMLEDCGAELLITQRNLQERVRFAGGTVDVDDPSQQLQDSSDLTPVNSPGHLAYLIYTSGTTGKPKGVMIEHRHVIRLLINDKQLFDFNERDVWTVFHSFCFDFSVWEMYGALLYGGACVVIPKTVAQQPAAFLDVLVQEQVTVLNQTPTAFYALLQEWREEGRARELSAIRYIIFGGEALHPVQLKPWKQAYPQTKLINMYGITETTVHVTYKEITDQEIESNVSNIGGPIPTLKCYIMDPYRRLVPQGVVGEMYIGGDGVARGYWNRGELTNERFIANPYRPEERLYKSGDLAKLLPNGELEYLGRMDHQVKIRGHRIELGEVESGLLMHPAIREATVLALDDAEGQKFLCAYYVSEEELTAGELRSHMSEELPGYMIPSRFVHLDKMPVTSNGKVDRKSLPKPESGHGAGKDYVQPAEGTEAAVAGIWQVVLEAGRVGADDNFFELGGHSLKAMQILSRIRQQLGVDVPLKVLFETPTVRELARYVSREVRDAQSTQYEPIPVAPVQDHYPLSSAQKRLYVLQQFEGGGTSYNMPGVFFMDGPLDRQRFEAAFAELIARHEALRTSFRTIDGVPVQVVHDHVIFAVGAIRVTGSGIEIEELAASFIRPFELSEAPLIRVCLVELAAERHLLLFDMHHIISDAMSIQVLIRELTELYRGEHLTGLPVPYKDYALWQNRQLETEALNGQLSYWLGALSGELPVLDLPLDYPRPAVQSFEGGVLTVSSSADLAGRLNRLAAQTGTTLYMVLLAAYQALLYTYTGQDDLIVGTPVAGRSHPETEGTIGMFVNTQAIRSRPGAELTFRQLLAQVRETALGAFQNGDFPFELLVDKLGLARDMSRNPLFDTMFSLQNAGLPELSLDGLELAPYPLPGRIAKFDLSLEASERGSELVFEFEYAAKLFRRSTIERIAGHWLQMLQAVAEHPDRLLGELDLLTEDEKHEVLVRFNDSYREYPPGSTFPELFELAAAAYPQRTAVIVGDAVLSYRELNERANRLARVLREKGVGPDRFAAVLLERSVDLIVGVIAVLKAGGAYVPIDPDYPHERVRYMLEDSGAMLVLTQRTLTELAGDSARTLLIEECDLTEGEGSNLERIHRPEHLAYMIYTSGTTGKPKGVMIEHRSWANAAFAWREAYRLDSFHVHLLQMASAAFDVFAGDLARALVNGGKLVLCPNEVKLDPASLSALLEEHEINIFESTPALIVPLMQYIAEQDQTSNTNRLKLLILGSDSCSAEDFRWLNERFGGSMRILNSYGVTEACIDSSFYEEGREVGEPAYAGSVPIGSPLPNMRLYIVDPQLRPLPVGVAGELIIGGAGVARGYHRLPELTEAKFVDSPFVQGERLYRTGDMGKWLPDGNVQFLGRNDHQVKIRGFRIELGEIEASLLKMNEIREAVVLARSDSSGGTYLCAYVAADEEVSLAALRTHLAAELPAYMVPARFVRLDRLPLTPNGKVDRNALPAPEWDIMRDSNYSAPRSELERLLAAVWSEVLGVPEVGVTDDFFRLGGHSLRAMQLISRMHKACGVEIPLRQFFHGPTVEAVAEWMQQQSGVNGTAEWIPVAPAAEYYRVSSAQRRMYIVHQLDLEGLSYNMPDAIAIEGKLDVERCEAAFRKMIERHETLRTTFHLMDGAPMQKIHPSVEFELELELDAPEHPDSVSLEERMSRFVRPFDLSQAPLLRLKLVRLAPERHMLLCDIHHIVSDGITVSLLMRQFSSLYAGEELPPLPIQYKDYAVWQQKRLEGGRIRHQEAYWLNQFAGELPVLDLPTDEPRPAVQSFAGRRHRFQADRELMAGLNKVAAETGTTLYMVLLAAYSVLLSRYAGQQDLIIGSPIAGRPHADVQDVAGMFVGTLAMRTRPEGGKSWHTFLNEVKETCLGAFDHQDNPFEELIEKLELRRDASRHPLFDTMFVLQNTGDESIVCEGLRFEWSNWRQQTSKFDLTLEASERPDGIGFEFEYCTALFREETVKRWSAHLLQVLRAVVRNPESLLEEVDLLSEEERAELLALGNDTWADYPKMETIHGLFERQAAMTPEHTALVCGGVRLTYRELNSRANRLAYMLRRSGVQPDDRVGLLAERSVAMVVGILAVLKAGGAYVPLDPDYPEERLRYMLEDSGSQVLVMQPHLADKAPFAGTVVNLDDYAAAEWSGAEEEGLTANASAGADADEADSIANPEPVNRPEDMAYIIYTSGTTGKPKGVMIEHRNVVRLLHNDRMRFDFSDRDVWTVFHSFCFDFSVWEMYGALLFGGTCVVVPKTEAQQPKAFLELLKREQVTVLNQTPTAFYSLIQAELTEDGRNFGESCDLALRYVIFGGEALNPAMLRPWHATHPRAKLINMYGITETTVHVTYKEITESDMDRSLSNIGTPIATLTAYILDERKKLAPIGAPGELYVGGEGVARGYLNRPELTAERFIRNPYRPEERLYRSGDLARRLPNGEMEYLGRIDHQVKIRGHRIELGEIETRLLQHAQIRETVVLPHRDRKGDDYLCAYLVSDTELTVKELRAFLAANLPAYMIPSHFVRLARIPQTPNGKVDRKALPQPEQGLHGGAEYKAPSGVLEETLVRLWEEALGSGRIGVNDSFFELGGHSLKAMTLISDMHKACGVEVPLKQLFDHPTVEETVRFIEAKRLQDAGAEFASIPKAAEQPEYPVSSAQKRIYMLSQMEGAETGYHMPAALLLEGKLDSARLAEAFRLLIQRHESLRTSFWMKEGEPVQIVHPAVRFELTALEPMQSEEADIEKRMERFIRPFELDRAPLLRAGLAACGTKKHLLLLDMHHIVSDGVSVGVLIRDLLAFYNGEQLPAPNVQYKDFAAWHASYLESEAVRRQATYWLDTFAGELPVLHLPYDYARPPVKSFEGGRTMMRVEPELAERLNRLAQENGATLYMVLLSVYLVLLHKLTGQDDLVVGTPTAGRPHSDLKDTIGMFVNTLAIRGKVDADQSFGQLLASVKENTLQAFANQDVPFEALVEKLGIPREASRNPLFDTMLILQNMDRPKETPAGLSMTPAPVFDGQTKFDLTFEIREEQGGLELVIDYAGRLFRPETAERMGRSFLHMLETASNGAELKIADMGLLSKAEERELATRFNDTAAELPQEPTLHALFEAQAAKTPDRTALVCAGQEWTYRELNERAERLAGALRRRGVYAEQRVGILAERSPELVVGLLAVLKAGGAYVPIDPAYPEERIRYMIEDSGIRLLLTCGQSLPVADGNGQLAMIDLRQEDSHASASDGSNEQQPIGPHHLAYIIYTSGTTGMPKGVMIEHRSVVNNLLWRAGEYALGTSDAVLQLFSPSFDGFITSFFTPVISGAAVVMPSESEAKDPLAIRRSIARHHITHFICVPSLYGAIVDVLEPEEAASLRIVTVAGEKVSGLLVERSRSKLPHVELVNEYGPTESSVVASWKRGLQPGELITIGRPVANSQLYIVDPGGRLVPQGVTGELCIGGAGLARGYLNKPELTAERFVPNPFPGGSERMYKTGDLARWRPDGTVEYLGRVDEQVKLRGYRIELAEIEAVLLRNPAIKDAAATVKTNANGDAMLCAYVTSDETVHAAELMAQLMRSVPAYMVPGSLMQLDRMPVTANGKLDRKRLPEPEAGLTAKAEYEPPANDTEVRLACIVESLLGVERVGMHDHFFDLGGHSLHAMMLVSHIYKAFEREVPLRAVFEAATIREIAGEIADRPQEIGMEAIRPVPQQPDYPLSSAQKRMYVLNQIEGLNVSYNMPGVLRVEGPLDSERFAQAFQELVDRHEILRTSFVTREGEPVQVVHPRLSLNVEMWEVREEDAAELVKRFVRPFDLKQAPLLRVGLAKLAEDKHLILFDMHHIVTDGLSMGIVVNEFVRLYQGEPLPEPQLHYKDFAKWQNDRFRSGLMQKQEAYWLDVFAEEIPLLDLPTDHPRPAVRSFDGSTVTLEIGADLAGRMRELAAANGATLFMLLLASYSLLLSKYTNQSDIVIGSPAGGRNNADLDGMIGMFVNTLAFRTMPESYWSFEGYLADVKETVLKGFEHQEYPFEMLVDQLNLKRDLSRNPLFDTMLVLQNLGDQTIRLDGLEFQPYENKQKTSKFDLSVIVEENGDALIVTLEYVTALFTEETMHRFARHFVRLLEQLTESPDQPLSVYDVLAPEEKQKLLFQYNDTRKPYPDRHTIHGLFEEQAALRPHAVAVIGDDGATWTYGELNRRANAQARRLQKLGLGAEQIAAIMMDRTPEMIAAVLAVMKAGGAYLPIDPDYPEDRIRYMLEDSGAKLIAAQSPDSVPAGFRHLAIEADAAEWSGYAEENPDAAADPGRLAYVIYTSGTTGKPKGILLEHKGVANLKAYFEQDLGITPADTVGQFASSSFDASVWEMFMALLTGAALVIVSKETIGNTERFEDIVRERGISVLTLPPTYLTYLRPEKIGRSLKKLITAGSATRFELVNEWKRHAVYLNAYGPTETTICATVWQADDIPANGASVPIGKPIRNLQAYIVDSGLRLAPIGVAGELCIGGVGLARGYLNRPELTAEKFVPNPWAPGEKMYRTGDLARWLPDGTLEYLGRIDHQVKIRGYRIEPAEIEAVLSQHPDIVEATVLARTDRQGQSYLCAYYVSDSGAALNGLRAYTAQQLPEYMVPAYFVGLTHMPLTSNGKINRDALPEPVPGAGAGTEAGEGVELPRNAQEQLLADIWRDVLGADPVGIRSHFFELGGDSIKGIQVATRLYQQGYQLELKDIFQHPVLEELAGCLQPLGRHSSQETVEGAIPLTPIQRWFFEQRFADMHHWNQAVMLYRKKGFDPSAVKQAMTGIYAHHDALRMMFIAARDGTVTQVNQGLDAPPPELAVFDLRLEPEPAGIITDEANRLQSGFDLGAGPLLQAALFQTADGDHLLLAAHHLVVDGVSWRILLEDFGAGYEQALRGEDISLPLKTDSFLAWAEHLQTCAQSEAFRKEAEYWRQASGETVARLPKDHAQEEPAGTMLHTRTVSFELNEEETSLLLKQAGQAYGTDAQVLLLTALGLALKGWTKEDRIAVELEGHGREEESGRMNVTRTVGWFTAAYPAVLDMSRSDDLAYQIKWVKEHLRRIPNKGIGYGLYRYAADASFRGREARLKPEISFNYLGQFEASVDKESDITFSPYDPGEPISPNAHRPYVLDVTGLAEGGKLRITIGYSARQYETATMEQLLDRYRTYLGRVMEHCLAKEGRELTPSDLGDVELSLEELDSLLDFMKS